MQGMWESNINKSKTSTTHLENVKFDQGERIENRTHRSYMEFIRKILIKLVLNISKCKFKYYKRRNVLLVHNVQ